MAETICGTHCNYSRTDGQAEWAWVAWINTGMVDRPKVVTNPSSDRTRRRLSSLMWRTPLPLYTPNKPRSNSTKTLGPSADLKQFVDVIGRGLLFWATLCRPPIRCVHTEGDDNCNPVKRFTNPRLIESVQREPGRWHCQRPNDIGLEAAGELNIEADFEECIHQLE